jgi:hypothetical protein
MPSYLYAYAINNTKTEQAEIPVDVSSSLTGVMAVAFVIP